MIKIRQWRNNPTAISGFLYTSSSLIKSFVGIVSGFLVLRYVAPEEIGIWQAFFIISTYAGFLNAGVPSGLNREIPFLFGKGMKEKAFEMAAAAKYFSQVCGGIAFLAMALGTALMLYFQQPWRNILAFSGVLVLVALEFLYGYYIVLYRTNEAFRDFSKVNIAESVLLVGLFPAIIYFGFTGFVVYKVLTSLIFLLLLKFYNPIKVRASFNRKHIVDLIKIGLPIAVMGYLYGIGKSFIKFALLYHGGVLLLGVFAPVFAIISAIKILPKTLARFFYPKFSYELGKTGDTRQLWKKVQRISFYLAIMLCLFFIPVIFLIPFFIETFLPKYTESIFAAQMVTLSALIASSFLGVHALNSLKAYKGRLIITLIYLITAAAFPFSLPLFFQNPIIGISVSLVVVDIVNFVVSYFVTRYSLLNAKTIG
ncbi:MAG: lipopolysaccharide biosynthesis protein [Bacteroidales bacterium]